MIWLTEFHQRWHAARGKRVSTANRAFSVDWVKLLEAAGIICAEDQATATRELVAFERAGHFTIKRHRYRKYLIERVTLPQSAEPWLRDHFGTVASTELQARSLEIIQDFSKRRHERFPAEWSALCESLRKAFTEARSVRPFHWRHPDVLQRLLEIVRNLSEREWEVGTPIRTASVEIGLDSKGLERHQRTVESGLTALFGSAISLKSLGFVSGESHVELHGPVCLHFPDGSSHDFDGLKRVLISAADLARCSSITTTAERLLTIENRKTTFRQYAEANTDRRTLVASTSFPTPAFREFLTKLPTELPHFHFGDTDPSGWHILLKLREAIPRPVKTFRMKWRPANSISPVTPHDVKLLPSLLTNPLLADVRESLETIDNTSDRGDFEQETLPPPDSGGWPFGNDLS